MDFSPTGISPVHKNLHPVEVPGFGTQPIARTISFGAIAEENCDAHRAAGLLGAQQLRWTLTAHIIHRTPQTMVYSGATRIALYVLSSDDGPTDLVCTLPHLNVCLYILFTKNRPTLIAIPVAAGSPSIDISRRPIYLNLPSSLCMFNCFNPRRFWNCVISFSVYANDKAMNIRSCHSAQKFAR